MHSNPWSDAGFRMQIICLTLAPSFVAAALYLLLKHFVLYCGPEYSTLKTRPYSWVFVGCDFDSIVLQAAGGGLAAAGGDGHADLLKSGNDFIMAGIAFQVVTMSACGILVLVYLWRYRRDAVQRDAFEEKSTYQLDKEHGNVSIWKVHFFGCMAVLAYIMVLVRCIYRLPEMAGGWGNSLVREENEFLLLDGMMVAIACVVLTVFHPAFYFPPFVAFRKQR